MVGYPVWNGTDCGRPLYGRVGRTENGMVVMWLVIKLMLSSSGLLSLNQHDFGWLVVEDLIKDQINHSNYGTKLSE